MLARMSELLVHTLREDPADAEVPSHRLLVRAGYVRRVAAGIYSWLPLGKRVLDRVARIVREEMEQIGAQEVLLPALLPAELYRQSGRWDEYGDLLLRLRDRKDLDYLLGPTHEELFASIVKAECPSYRDFPKTLFQIQSKFRDEARPRAGLLRSREFIMKDSYSFDLDDEGLGRSYASHRAAYHRIFERLELDVAVVSAVSGAMGGSKSEEFLARSEVGEDSFVSCPTGDFTANTEAVELRPSPAPSDTHGAASADAPDPAAGGAGAAPVREVDTPSCETIEALVTYLTGAEDPRGPVDAAGTLKNVVFCVRQPDGSESVLIVGVPGDREVDHKRLEAAIAPATARPFAADDFAAHRDLVQGYIGPVGLAGDRSGYRYVTDPLVAPGSAWVTGANRVGKHLLDAVVGRDFQPDATLNAATVRDGDPCPRCGGPLRLERGIEVGHIFQLGTKYTDVFEVDALNRDGRPTRVTMGSYGIGVTRAVATVVEQHHDEAGLRWPVGLAPYQVHVVSVAKSDAGGEIATSIGEELAARGVDVLLDDRSASAGEKFADADLLGMPFIVVVGRSIDQGLVEVKTRATGDREQVAIDQVAAHLASALHPSLLTRDR